MVAAASAALFGTSSVALASAGCTAFNGSFTGGVLSGNTSGTGFDAGDTIKLTITAVGGADTLGLYNDTTHNPLIASNNTVGTQTYSVPAATSDRFIVSGVRANAGSSFTWSCVAGGSGGSTSGDVQTDGTSTVGKTSATAIVGAVGDATDQALDKDPVPTPAPRILTREEYIAAGVELWGEGSADNSAYQYDLNQESGLAPIRNPGGAGFVWIDMPTEQSAVSSYLPQTKSDAERYVDDVFASLSPGVFKASASLAPQWSTWADIRLSGFEHATPNTMTGLQINALAGITYDAMPGVVIGAFAGYEAFNYEFAAITGNLKGGGATLGTNAGINVTPTLRWKGSLAWTGLGYDTKTGAATGNFAGSRVMLSTGLTGKVDLGDYVVEPSADILALWEHQTAYTDSAATAHGARNSSNGRVALGAKATAQQWADVFTPYLGIYGDWSFASAGGSAWSGRINGGINMPISTNGSLSLGAEYGGIGANYKTWSGNAQLKVQF